MSVATFIACVRAGKVPTRTELLEAAEALEQTAPHRPPPAPKSVREQALQILSFQLDVPVEEIRDSSSVVDDLGADSLAIVEIVISFEEHFEMDIPDDEVSKCITVGDVVRALRSAVDSKNKTGWVP